MPTLNPLGRFVVAGIDEAGRGPLAGPVTVACVSLPARYRNPKINDSKLLTAAVRDELYAEIVSIANAYAVVSIGPRRIERFNIREATKRGMYLSACLLKRRLKEHGHVYYLVDGNMLVATDLKHETIIKGDQKILSIAAASIVAKVTRDRIMGLLEHRYPGYGFVKHKGYGTIEHRRQLGELGPSRVHRRTFSGVAEFFAAAGGSEYVEQLDLIECDDLDFEEVPLFGD